MIPVKKMSQLELAAYVQTYLLEYGIDVILSGGSAVSFYSQNQYVTKDIGLISNIYIKRSTLVENLAEIGFVEIGRYFQHQDSPFLIEFPTGPLAVGEEPVKQINEYSLASGILRIISPTDCVKDRLLAFFHWNDRQSLSQALLIAQSNKIGSLEIERWAIVEDNQDKYIHFTRLL